MIHGERYLFNRIYMVLRSPARNEPRSQSGLLQMLGGRVFQTLVVCGKKECLCTFMFDLGKEYLCLRAGWIVLGNWTLTSWCFDFIKHSQG